MISPKDFVEALKERGVSNFTGVPCSFFQAAMNCVIDDAALRYTMVPNEGSALALAAGAYFGGKPTAVLIQNSGLGNLINPLTSLHMIYRLPVLLFVSGRAYGVKDEPQHEIIGKTMGDLLGALEVKYEDMPEEIADFKKSLEKALKLIQKKGQPFVFFVKKGALDDYTPLKKDPGAYPLKRIDAIKIVAESLKGDELVIATTGKPSRELFATADRPENFYMQGSMGHAASIGLGLALSRPDKKVLVLDGDGAILMHLGILSSIGHYKPKNLVHVVLDNESYETTGDQDTTSSSTDLKRTALACGYAWVDETVTEEELRGTLKIALKKNGPVFLRVKINRLPTEEIPRISSKYDSPEIAAHFKKAVLGEK